MHPSAYKNCEKFFEIYAKKLLEKENVKIVEIGSQDVNGSLRNIFPASWNYTGLDFAAGRGVDIVLDDAYNFPLESEMVDIVITSSCFEHSEMFWLTFLEALRILKPTGLLYINAPSNGVYHAYPGDSWRFFPDAGRSLSKWAQHNGLNTVLLESYISYPDRDIWDDFVSIFLKDRDHYKLYEDRIINHYDDYYNARINPDNLFGPLIREKRD